MNSLELQRDLDRLMECEEMRQLPFNVCVYTVMHIGRGNTAAMYNMKSTPLMGVMAKEQEQDLAVWIKRTKKPSKNVKIVVNKANQIPG
jgi:hypothetical protein